MSDRADELMDGSGGHYDRDDFNAKGTGAFDRLREWAIKEIRILNDGGYAQGDGSAPDPDDVSTLLGHLTTLSDKCVTWEIQCRGAEARAKALLDAKNYWQDRAVKAEADLKDCDSALSQAEAAARAYQQDLRDARAEARYR